MRTVAFLGAVIACGCGRLDFERLAAGDGGCGAEECGCEGVDCAGHGTCEETAGGAPTCDCEPGFVNDGPTACTRGNTAPVALDLGIATTLGTSVDIRLHAYDRDGDALTYRVVDGPAHGSIAGGGPVVTYTPEPGYTGDDRFLYRANDGALDSNSATVRIVVGGSALFVVGSVWHMASTDVALLERMEGRGLQVEVVVDYASQTSDAEGRDLVVISSTSVSSRVGRKFRDVPVPVVTWEKYLYDDMGLTGWNTYEDYGMVSNQTQIAIVDPHHPLAAGLSGAVSVLESPGEVNWGRPTDEAHVVATVLGHPDEAVVFAYEPGATLAGGFFKAPARRVGFLGGGGGSRVPLSPAGEKLFDAAIDYALAP